MTTGHRATDIDRRVEGQTVGRGFRRHGRRARRPGRRCAGRTATAWGEWTFAEYADRVARAAAGLPGAWASGRATGSC